MQFDAVEAGLLRAQGGIGEQTGQHLRQVADMRQVHVGDALAIAEFQRFQFALGQDLRKFVALHAGERGADIGVAAGRAGRRDARR